MKAYIRIIETNDLGISRISDVIPYDGSTNRSYMQAVEIAKRKMRMSENRTEYESVRK